MINCLDNIYVPLDPSSYGWQLINDNWEPVWYKGNPLPNPSEVEENYLDDNKDDNDDINNDEVEHSTDNSSESSDSSDFVDSCSESDSEFDDDF